MDVHLTLDPNLASAVPMEVRFALPSGHHCGDLRKAEQGQWESIQTEGGQKGPKVG